MTELNVEDIDVKDLLEVLKDQGKLRNLTFFADEANFSCPFGGHSFGDASPSAYMNVDTTAWICHGCGMRGNAVRFVAALEGVPPYTAAAWLEKRYCLPQFYGPELESKVRELMDAKPKAEEAKVGTPVLDETSAFGVMTRINWDVVRDSDQVPAALGYLPRRGFSYETLARYSICFDPNSSRLALPIRDRFGRLVGFKGRAWHDEHQPRYLVLGDTPRSIAARGEMYGFQPYRVAAVLWGMDSVEVVSGCIIVTEGELNALMMRQYGWKNVVGLSGSYLSEEHVSQIRDVASSAILRFDARKDGRFLTFFDDNGNERDTPGADAAKRLSVHMPTKLCLPHEGDPASMTAEQVSQLMGDARSLLECRVSHRG